MIDLKGCPFYLKDEDISWIRNTIDAMSLEEKIGQLFCMNIRDFSDEMLEMMHWEMGYIRLSALPRLSKHTVCVHAYRTACVRVSILM